MSVSPLRGQVTSGDWLNSEEITKSLMESNLGVVWRIGTKWARQKGTPLGDVLLPHELRSRCILAKAQSVFDPQSTKLSRFRGSRRPRVCKSLKNLKGEDFHDRSRDQEAGLVMQDGHRARFHLAGKLLSDPQEVPQASAFQPGLRGTPAAIFVSR